MWDELHLRYEGKPVHPALVLALKGREKQSTAAVAVDIASENEQVFLPVPSIDGMRIGFAIPDTDPQAEFAYERIGVLLDGTQVLKTYESEGGTGVFIDLLFVRIAPGSALLFDPSSRPRLVMTLIGRYPMGDRDGATIRISGNSVRIGRSRYRDREVVLQVPSTSAGER